MAARLDTFAPIEPPTLWHRGVRWVRVHAKTVVVDTMPPTDSDPGPGSGVPPLCTTPQRGPCDQFGQGTHFGGDPSSRNTPYTVLRCCRLTSVAITANLGT